MWQRIKQFNVRNKCESARKFFTSAILDHFQNKRLICAVNHQHGEDVRACNAETQGYSYHYITPSREFHMDVNESNKDIYLRIVKQTQDGEEEFEYIEKGEIAEEHADGYVVF